MGNFWVTGGEFADTEFRDLAPGAKAQRLGPFKTYEDARVAWLAQSFAHVDHCNVRFVIVNDDHKPVSASAAA